MIFGSLFTPFQELSRVFSIDMEYLGNYSHNPITTLTVISTGLTHILYRNRQYPPFISVLVNYHF